MRVDKSVPVEVLRRDYRELADAWLALGDGDRAAFDSLVRELADVRHGRRESHRPVDLVFAARFISLSRSNEQYKRWFTAWRARVSS
jgi:hypothetical protein